MAPACASALGVLQHRQSPKIRAFTFAVCAATLLVACRARKEKPEQAGKPQRPSSTSKSCPGMPPVPQVPRDWIRFPGLPCECNVWVAPEGAITAKVGWEQNDSHGQTLVDADSGTPVDLIAGTALGDEHEGSTYVSYLRALNKGLHELVTVELAAPRVTFQARIVGGFHAPCFVRAVALHQGMVLFHAWQSRSGQGPRLHLLAGGPASAAVPVVWQRAKDASVLAQARISSELVAIVPAPETRMVVYQRSGERLTTALQWQAPPGSTLENLLAWDKTVLFTTYTGRMSRAWRWRSGEQVEPLFATANGAVPDAARSSVCGFGTDGETLVWTRASGWSEPNSSWKRFEVLRSPFLEPTKSQVVAPAPGGIGRCLPWHVRGATAAARQLVGTQAGGSYEFTLLDLANRSHRPIPARPSRRLHAILALTNEAILLEEGAKDGHGGATIVRLPKAAVSPSGAH